MVIVVAAGLFFLFNNQNAKNSNQKTTKQSPAYTVDYDSKSYASIAKSAIESYATQDISESQASRYARLKPFFSPDSPVLNRDIEIRSTNSAVKTTAKVTSIRYSAEDSDINPVLVVDADVTSISGNDKSTSQQSYLLTLTSTTNGSYLAKDIEVIE